MCLLQVYWVGPILGSLVGVLFYQYVIAGDATLKKVKAAVFCKEGYVPTKHDERLSIKRVRKPSLMAHFEDLHYADRKADDTFYPLKHDECDGKCDGIVEELTELGSNCA